MQAITQVGYRGPEQAVAVIVALSFGLNLMPAYLDYKSCTVAETVDPSYYDITVHRTENQHEAADAEAPKPVLAEPSVEFAA